MSETAQVLIVAVITVLTIILSLVGIQIVYVLRDIRKTLNKVNSILDDSKNLTGKLSRSSESLSGMITGLKTALSIIGIIKGEKG